MKLSTLLKNETLLKCACVKCGSKDFHLEVKGNNTGLYCNNCGKWIKWLSKDEVRAFEFYQKHKVELTESKNISNDFIKEELERFVDFLDVTIENELTRNHLSKEDDIRKCSYCLALERDKNAIINILNGKKFDEIED